MRVTCVGAGGQATLVKRLQEEPAHSAARPTAKHAGDDVIETQQGDSTLGSQVSQDEARLLHLTLKKDPKTKSADIKTVFRAVHFAI